MITASEASTAVMRMAVLKYFPSEEVARAQISSTLTKMVKTSEQLNWLVDSIINNSNDWKGLSQLRSLFCTRFKPADGHESKEDCQIPGFTPADCEATHHNRYLPSPDRKLLAAGEKEPDVTPDLELQGRIDALAAHVDLKAKRASILGLSKKEEYKEPQWLKDLGV